MSVARIRRGTDVAAAALFLTALLPRLALVLGKTIVSGENQIFLYARRPIPFWDPLPVVLHRVLLGAAGGHPIVLGILYAAAAAAVAPLIRLLARSLDLPPRAATLAGLGAAFYPYYVSTAWYQPEAGFTISLTAAVTLALVSFSRRPSARGAALVGAGTVSLVLDRADSVPYLLFLALLAWLRLRRTTVGRRFAPVPPAAVAVALVAVVLVNSLALGRFEPKPPKSGYNLLLGHNPAISAYLRRSHGSTLEDAVVDSAFAGFPDSVLLFKQNPIYSSLYTERALRYMRRHPRETLTDLFWKAVRTWDWRLEDADAEVPAKRAAYTLPYLLLLGLAGYGVRALPRGTRGRVAGLVLGGVLAASLPGLVTVPLIRVRMYTEFLLMLLAGAGLDAIARFDRSGSGGKRGPSGRPHPGPREGGDVARR